MTILKQLTVVGTPADGTTVSTSNTNLVGVTIRAGNTFTIDSAAAMGAAFGLRANQGGANQIDSYLDLTSATAQLAWRREFRYQNTPGGAGANVLRFFPDTVHTTNLGTISHTASNRVQFVEGGSGSPLSITSTGTTLTPGSVYVELGLIDVTANTFELRMYPFNSTTPVFTMSGTLGADMAAASGVQSIRHGINTATSGIGNYDINTNFALGNSWIDRTDVANIPPAVSLTANQSVSATTAVSITATATDSDGTIASYAWVGTRYSTTAAPAALTPTSGAGTATIGYTSGAAGTLDIWQCTVTDDDGAPTIATTEVRVGTSGDLVPLRGFATAGVAITNVGGAASVGEAMGDASDSTYGEWPATTGIERASRIRLCPSQSKSSLTGTFRLYKDVAGSLVTNVRLCQGTSTDGSTVTAVKEWSYNPITTSVADYTGTATTGELAGITDWGNVWLEVAEV